MSVTDRLYALNDEEFCNVILRAVAAGEHDTAIWKLLAVEAATRLARPEED